MFGEWVHKHRRGNGNTHNPGRGSTDLSDGLRARGLRPSYPSASKQAREREREAGRTEREERERGESERESERKEERARERERETDRERERE